MKRGRKALILANGFTLEQIGDCLLGLISKSASKPVNSYQTFSTPRGDALHLRGGKTPAGQLHPDSERFRSAHRTRRRLCCRLRVRPTAEVNSQRRSAMGYSSLLQGNGEMRVA
jgi:hypothetical protein